MGTSLPDTFASRIAAQKEKTADNAIGNANIFGNNIMLDVKAKNSNLVPKENNLYFI